MGDTITKYFTLMYGFISLGVMLIGLFQITGFHSLVGDGSIKTSLIVVNVGFFIGILAIMMYDEQFREELSEGANRVGIYKHSKE